MGYADLKFEEKFNMEALNYGERKMITVDVELNSGFLLWAYGKPEYNSALKMIDDGTDLLKELEKQFKEYLKNK